MLLGKYLQQGAHYQKLAASRYNSNILKSIKRKDKDLNLQFFDEKADGLWEQTIKTSK